MSLVMPDDVGHGDDDRLGNSAIRPASCGCQPSHHACSVVVLIQSLVPEHEAFAISPERLHPGSRDLPAGRPMSEAVRVSRRSRVAVVGGHWTSTTPPAAVRSLLAQSYLARYPARPAVITSHHARSDPHETREKRGSAGDRLTTKYPRLGSNQQPSASEADALSN